MSNLSLSVAIGPYDRMMPLVRGEVRIDAVDPQFMLLEPEEIFFRAMRHEAFDICELSLSSYSLRVARGDSPYVAVPVFPSRAFRHTCVVVRTDRGIARPAEGRQIRLAATTAAELPLPTIQPQARSSQPVPPPCSSRASSRWWISSAWQCASRARISGWMPSASRRSSCCW